MKHVLRGAVVMILGILVWSSCSKETSTKIEFASSLEEALQLASERNQSIIADFWREECSWCKRLEDSTFTDQRVVQLSHSMVFVKAEAGKDTVTGEKYRIAGFPTVILMNSSGEEIDRIFGFLPPDEFIATIQDYLQGKNTLGDLKKRFEADPENVQLASQLAEKHEGRRDYDEAAQYYKKILDLDPEDEQGSSDDALMSLAWLEVRRKDYPKAVETFKYFLQKFPRSEMVMEAEMYIPYTHERAGDTTKALGLYEKFLKAHPDSPDTDWVRGRMSKLKGEEEKKEGT